MSAPVAVLVVGAGRIGRRIARMLGADARFAPTLTAPDAERLEQAARDGIATIALSSPVFGEALGLCLLRTGARALILADTALPAAEVAALARRHGAHYLDIFESPRSAAGVAALVKDGAGASGPALAPGCGLAPGYVTALASEMLETLGRADEMTVFVGVLPTHPVNRLGYANIWGVEGLIAEYTQPCIAIRDGAVVRQPPLSGVEELTIAGTRYEAFTTAGSIDDLATAQEGRVSGLVFKTLRYPGHLDYMQFLLDDLGLTQRTYLMRNLLLTSLPRTDDDRVIIAIRLQRGEGAPAQWTTQVFEARPDEAGRMCSAIATATAAHACAVLDLLCSTGIGARGLVTAGQIGPSLLRASPFFALLEPVAGAFGPGMSTGSGTNEQPHGQTG